MLAGIAEAAVLAAGETVVEVGAGLGSLTAELAQRASKVVAVEIDEELCSYLRRRLRRFPNVHIVCADILALTPEELLQEGAAHPPYAVVGNLPYYITAPVLRHFLETPTPPRRLMVMVQREVAESIVAGPGRMSLLGLSVQFYGAPRMLFSVPPSAFYPPPRVHSAVLAIDVRESPAVAVDDASAFFSVARAGFAAPRKQLRNSLALGLGLPPETAEALLRKAGLDPRQRAQELALDDWAVLYRACESLDSSVSSATETAT
jgi:16S rRNA (adenine1518-N6/adenine1519-N6)-dimethyltransferase